MRISLNGRGKNANFGKVLQENAYFSKGRDKNLIFLDQKLQIQKLLATKRLKIY